MSSFQPVAVVFGSTTSIATANLQLPVSILFAFDVKSLEQIVNVTPQLSDISLYRYFVILLDYVDNDILERLSSNYRVKGIYNQPMTCVVTQRQINQMMNSSRQLTLDVTTDIITFLTTEGQKQIQLERMSVVKIYYQQARVLKEWVMSLCKAEPCHILLISLNSTQENVDIMQQQLQKICTKLNYPATIIRQLNDYIRDEDRHSSLIPYSKLFFNHENPIKICELIKKLSPIRLYLYGNQLVTLSEWSKLMISTETSLMNDEDNWCGFLESENIDDEVKWNFGFILGRQWQVSRVAPLDLSQLHENPRFSSALSRAHRKFAERQLEVTAEIFVWHGDCVKNNYIEVEPKLTQQQELTKDYNRMKEANKLLDACAFQRLSTFNYSYLNSPKIKSVTFIWLDCMLNDVDGQFSRIIEPFQWNLFDTISSCVSFLETKLREQRYIFLIASGLLGEEMFLSVPCLMNLVYAVYVFCAHLGPNLKWSCNFPQIRGVYNDPTLLADQMKHDYQELKTSLNILENLSCTESKTTDTNDKATTLDPPFPLALTVYIPDQVQLFMSHQRTIDTLLCMPRTSESEKEMFEEFRRIFDGNQEVLAQIESFENAYNSNAAIHWYTRDTFVCRTINQVLRSSDVDTMIKLRCILTDLYVHLNESYKQKRSAYRHAAQETFYRGQLMSTKDFDALKEIQGNIISMNTFFSATASMQIALMYAGDYHASTDMVPVVFLIEADPMTSTRPYANISAYSSFPDEEETLFAMGSIFLIGNIRQMHNADNVWTIQLKSVDSQDIRFNTVSLTTL